MASSDDMAAFVLAVDCGSFSAAARALDLTPSALSKLVTRLENRLGVRLLNRSTRRLSLTAEGEVYLERSRRILEEIAAAEAEVAQARERPRGLLRVTVGTAFGMHPLTPALPRFLARYPEIRLQLTVTDRVIDLIEEGDDVAVRVGPVGEASLIQRKICDLHRVICAAPSYLARRGVPATPDDLALHNCLTLSVLPELSRWPFKARGGVRSVAVKGDLVANNAESMLQLALLGHGIIRLADVIVGTALRDGRLVPILQDAHHAEPVPLSAVTPPGRHRAPKVAAFVAFLVEEFARAPWRG